MAEVESEIPKSPRQALEERLKTRLDTLRAAAHSHREAAALYAGGCIAQAMLSISEVGKEEGALGILLGIGSAIYGAQGVKAAMDAGTTSGQAIALGAELTRHELDMARQQEFMAVEPSPTDIA